MFNLTEHGEWLYSRAERPAEKPVENLPGVCYNKSVKTKLKGLRQRCGLRKDETLTKKPKFTLQLQYNSPVILTFFLLSLGVLFLGQWTGGWTTTHLFCVYRSSLKDPLFYVRLFGHVLGHGSWDHFLNNMLLLLVIGPPMEEKYGSIPLLRGILLTALISGILQCALFPHSALLGASGIVFMLIMLASLSGFSGGIPVTMLLVAVLYLGKIMELTSSDELYDHPLHPYTQALISAAPIPNPKVDRARERILLKGEIPSPLNPPEGCNFCTRCPYATDLCREVEPEFVDVGNDHWVACHRVSGK